MRDYLNVLEIADLPPTQRKIMRLILRKVEMTYADLCDAVDAMPETDRLSRNELDQVLEVLKADQWVVTGEKDDLPAYRVNLRRNATNVKLSRGERSSIWDALSLSDDTTSASSKSDPGNF